MMFCVIPEIHPLSEKNILTFNDISGQDFVSFPNGTYISYKIDRILGKKSRKLSSKTGNLIYC